MKGNVYANRHRKPLCVVKRDFLSTPAPGYDARLDPRQPAAPTPDVTHTMHPDAQWFPQAGFGLFMHWGIHSTAGLQPSWAMVKDYPYGGDSPYNAPEKYWALAPQFNPQHYAPDRWLAAAARAGFTYAVLTTKHHDGYALWPSRHGDFGVRQYLGGRDLTGPYVEACRRHGLRVGFYFSPRDWRYPGYPADYTGHDYRKGQNNALPFADPVRNQAEFDKFYAFTRSQIEELLTWYGRIDILWFDGLSWPGAEIPTTEIFTWVRSLQPGIVINNR